MDLQQLFFKRLREKLPNHLSVEHELAAVLGLSVEQVFLLMRGGAVLSFQQAETLSRHYSISLDSLREYTPNSLPFRYRALNYNFQDLDGYFETLVRELKQIDLFGGGKIVYAAADIPIFALFQFPELAAFKLFYWGKKVYELSEFKEKKFSYADFSPETLTIAERTWKQYLKIPSIEIWNSEVVNNVLRQIFSVWKAGDFESPQEALMICDQVTALLEHIEQQAKLGKKLHPYMLPPNKENYTLYYTETLITNNTIQVLNENSSITYIAHNALDFLTTDSPSFNAQMERWFHTIIGRSELISQANDELRTTFFGKMYDNIRYIKEEIADITKEGQIK